MEVDESDQFTQLDPDAPPISSSSASTNSIQRNIAFEYSTSPVVSPPTSDFDERFKSLETKLAKLLTFTGALKSGKAPASPTTRHASPAKKKKRDSTLLYRHTFHKFWKYKFKSAYFHKCYFHKKYNYRSSFFHKFAFCRKFKFFRMFR
jgi:hypothetical protein